jgi:DNA-binding IclR family transcriptional regulator
VSVIGKAIAVLDALLEAPGECSLAELSRILRMSRTTVHRLLATLESHGFVERTARGGYALGLHLFMLGSAVHERTALARLAGPHLETLADAFRVSSYLSIRDGDRALCLERYDRGGVQLAAYRTGETLPLHLGAGPMVLLAGLPDEEIDRVLAGPLLRPTADTIASPDALRARVATIRETGIAWADGDLEVGVLAVGAPVRDLSSRTIAAVSVAGLSQQMNQLRPSQLADAVRATARAIGDDLTRVDRTLDRTGS